jgi:hypothetical protein
VTSNHEIAGSNPAGGFSNIVTAFICFIIARVVGSSPTIILRDGVSSMAELVKHDVAT